MAINDFLSWLVIKLGLKQSREAKVKSAIEAHEKRLYQLEEEFKTFHVEVSEMDRKLKILKEQMEKTTSPDQKDIYAVQYELAQGDLERHQEKRDIAETDLMVEKEILHKLGIILKHLQAPPTDTDTIMDITDDVDDIIQAIEDQRELAIDKKGKRFKSVRRRNMPIEQPAPAVPSTPCNEPASAPRNDAADGEMQEMSEKNSTGENRQDTMQDA